MIQSFLIPRNWRMALIILFVAGIISPSYAFSGTRQRAKAKPPAKKSVATSRKAKVEPRRKVETARADRSSERGRGGRALSRRDRALEAARIRREREEEARRAEIAREQAIARQRAADQALRDETVANILRDDTTGEDLEVRRIAVEALGNHAGSVVVMEPKTGRVLAVVNQDWALRKGYKPCSTIKLVTGLAGLSEKIIDPTQTLNVTAANYAADLSDSLAFSNNGYFQHVGGDVGFDKMVKYARELGYGEKTGINESNEFSGRVPLLKTGSAVNHMSSHGDDFEVTPIQLGVLVSAIANGGKLMVPQLAKTPDEISKFKPVVRREITVPKDALQRMVPGMIGAVNYGTARLAFDPTETIAGKTGTCIGQGSWLGLFGSFAPVQDPQLAVVVVTRGSGERGKVAAGIAGRIYRGLDPRYGRMSPQLATNPRPEPIRDARTTVRDSDEDEEGDSMDADTSTTSKSSRDSKVKTVLMPVPSKSNSAKPSTGKGPASKTPAIKESTPDDIRIINEADPNGAKPSTSPSTDQSNQRPRRVNDKP